MMEERVPNNKFHLTFDLDWAPDLSIALCLDLLKKKKIKATFFTTHETDLNKEILLQGHELGIHPNFLSGSSHGSTTLEVVENCLNFAPNAKTLRTHALVQSSPMLFDIFNNFPQLKLDLSIFMHRAKTIERFKWTFNNLEFSRINYNWEDDAEFGNSDFDWSKPYFCGEITIYDFHPIHVLLNSKDSSHYENLKTQLNGQSLINSSIKLLNKNINHDAGAQTLLKEILNSTAQTITLDKIK